MADGQNYQNSAAGDSADPLLAMVDPELRAAAMQMRASMARFSPMTMEKLAERREWINTMAPGIRPGVSVAEHHIKHIINGEPDVGLFVVNAKPGQQGSGVLHLHGGGFTASSAMAGMHNVQDIAEALDCPVVTVDYRLAPETIWSGALEDNYTALLWMHRNAATIGIDPARIALLGESAGGGHAALLTVAARDRGEAPIAFQALIYPMLDDRTGSSRKAPAHAGHFGWNEEANRFGWACFLGREPGGAQSEGVPARIDNLSGLPSAFIGVGGLDLFADESVRYASRLMNVGVPVELLVAPGGFHGFDMFVRDAGISKRLTSAKLGALRRALGVNAAP